jgi:hypothetical protein
MSNDISGHAADLGRRTAILVADEAFSSRHMTAHELAAHLLKNVSTFRQPRVIGPGVAYHYSPHRMLIESTGCFLGAPLDTNLDFTQSELVSAPAKHDPGVVFAYVERGDAADEGFGCELFELRYRAAVLAEHIQEAALGAPETVLILTSDIESFECLGACSQFQTF